MKPRPTFVRARMRGPALATRSGSHVSSARWATTKQRARGGLRDSAFLSITGRVNSSGGEQGMLGLAFHPNYASNGRFFVTYTDGQGDLRISRFRNPDPEDNNAPESSEAILLQ